MADQQDTEFTLGMGKLLGLFFLLVILCGVFFSLGYTLGRNSMKPEGSLTGNDVPPVGAISTAAKPNATQGTTAKQADTAAESRQAPTQNDLTFYKAVEQKDADAQLQKPEATEAPKSAPEMKQTLAMGFVVQVAAVSKKEDAEALQQALQRKQYPVIVAPGNGDKLFHVQMGPFADLKDAETMKGRLAADGYNAIVKK